MAEINGNGKTSWMRYALGVTGGVILFLASLGMNSLNSQIMLLREDTLRKFSEQKDDFSRQIGFLKEDYQRSYSDFTVVRGEQMARTGRLTALETKIDLAMPELTRRISSLETRVDKLETRN